MLIGNEKRLGPARGKRPPVMESQQSSLTEPTHKKEDAGKSIFFFMKI
ncbi:MAG: hypothetical protein ACE3JN_04160 [Ectobacillus sp.]